MLEEGPGELEGSPALDDFRMQTGILCNLVQPKWFCDSLIPLLCLLCTEGWTETLFGLRVPEVDLSLREGVGRRLGRSVTGSGLVQREPEGGVRESRMLGGRTACSTSGLLYHQSLVPGLRLGENWSWQGPAWSTRLLELVEKSGTKQRKESDKLG